MNQNKFDPFNHRLARDIRNTLSKSFIESLAERDASIFQKRGSEYLMQDLKQVYQMYLKTRLEKYDEVFVSIEKGRINDVMQQSEILWDHELYFEMHELLEKVWIRAVGNERKALQGLIRAAGMKIHAENGNIKAAVTMGQKAQADLHLYGRVLSHFNKLDTILAEIEQTISNMPKTTDNT